MEFVTIKDISQKAGVSPATVSRVLNNPSIVNPATREKVERIMNELHYVPSAVARNLSKSSSTIIGAIVADISNPFLSQLLKGVLTVCDREGYMLICMDNSDNMNSDFRALNAMREQRVAGLIYAPAVDYSYYSKTEKLKHFIDALCAPVVLVDRKVCWDEIPFDGVFFNDYEAIKKAVHALAASGHRRIALINSDEKNALSDNRLCAYLDGIREAGLEADQELIYAKGAYSLESGYRQTKELLRSKSRPTAVITCNNLLSQGFMKAASEAKVTAEQITHIGLDNLKMTETLGIKYNHIERDPGLMGEKAAEMLFWRMAHPRGAKQALLLDAPLVLQTNTI